MLTAVKGVYRNGVATPVEDVDLPGPADVLIVFQGVLESDRPRFLRAAGAWSDLDTAALKERISASRAISTREPARL